MRRSVCCLRIAVVLSWFACAGSCAREPAQAREVHVPDPSSKRTLSTGELIGFAQKNSASQTWLGIPFAQPPVGALRWRAPQPPALWSGVREALNFGSACPQLANPIGDTPNAEPGTVTGHEDCLYLNVYAPRGSAEQAAQRKLPVMVWLHGGGNSVGHAGTYDGGDLAARYDLIVVTTNYRLGPFGWFRQPALLSDTPGDEQSGNWGMLDQIRALEWVRENVAAFGGDPGNVTIFGESAGGVDVLGLLVSKRAEGLFHRAISQSGGTNSSSLAEAENPTDAAQPGNKNSSAEATLRILFPGIGRADAAARAKALQPALIAARLRAASPKEVFAAYTAVKGARPGAMLDMPALVRDGSTLPLETEQELFAQGRYHHVPVILGTNHDELKLFLLSDPKLLRNWIRVLPMFRDELRYQVTSDYGTMGWKMSSLDAPAAEMRRVQGPSVFVYRFDWDEEPRILWSDFAKLLGAAHGMEIPFVFRHFEGNGFARLFTDANRPGREQLADAMSSYWANFAYTGAPGRGRNGKLPEWRAIDLAEGGDKQIVFDTAEGGGVRMDKHVITKASLLAQLARDPRMNDQIRCEIFQGMVDYKTLSPSDREAAGCTAKGLKGLGAR